MGEKEDEGLQFYRCSLSTLEAPCPELGLRPYQEVLVELASFKYGSGDDNLPRTDTFINKHILRTIGFALNNKSVASETKKMIQLVRHQFSRKRGDTLGTSSGGSGREMAR